MHHLKLYNYLKSRVKKDVDTTYLNMKQMLDYTGCLSQIKHFRMPEMKLGYLLFPSVSSSSWRGELAIFKIV